MSVDFAVFISLITVSFVLMAGVGMDLPATANWSQNRFRFLVKGQVVCILNQRTVKVDGNHDRIRN